MASTRDIHRDAGRHGHKPLSSAGAASSLWFNGYSGEKVLQSHGQHLLTFLFIALRGRLLEYVTTWLQFANARM